MQIPSSYDYYFYKYIQFLTRALLFIKFCCIQTYFFQTSTMQFVICDRSKLYTAAYPKSSPYANSHICNLIFHISCAFPKHSQMNIFKKPSQFQPMYSNRIVEMAITNTGRNNHKPYSMRGNWKLLANNCFFHIHERQISY